MEIDRFSKRLKTIHAIESNQDNGKQLFIALFQNEYLKNRILGFIRDMCKVDADNNPYTQKVRKFELSSKQQDSTFYVGLEQTHAYLSQTYKYHQLHNVDWMASRGYIGLIKYKLERDDHLVFSTNSPKLICMNIGPDQSSDIKLILFKYIYEKMKHLFYNVRLLVESLVMGGSVKCLKYIMESGISDIKLNPSHLIHAFVKCRLEMLKYLYSIVPNNNKYLLHSTGSLEPSTPPTTILEMIEWIKNTQYANDRQKPPQRLLVKFYIQQVMDYNINKEEVNWDGIFNQEIKELVDWVQIEDSFTSSYKSIKDEKIRLACQLLLSGLVSYPFSIYEYIFVVRKSCDHQVFQCLFSGFANKATRYLLTLDQLRAFHEFAPTQTVYVYLTSLVSSFNPISPKNMINNVNFFDLESLKIYLSECTEEEIKTFIKTILFNHNLLHRHHYNVIAKYMYENYKKQIEDTKPSPFTLYSAIHSNLYPPLINLIAPIALNGAYPGVSYKAYSLLSNYCLVEDAPIKIVYKYQTNYYNNLAKVGNIKLLDQLEKIENHFSMEFVVLVNCAVYGSQLDMLNHFSQNDPMKLDLVLQNLIQGGHIAKIIGNYGALNLLKSPFFNVILQRKEYIDLLLVSAIEFGHISIIKYIYENGFDNIDMDENWFVETCFENLAWGMIEYVYKIGRVDITKQLKRDFVKSSIEFSNYLNNLTKL